MPLPQFMIMSVKNPVSMVIIAIVTAVGTDQTDLKPVNQSQQSFYSNGAIYSTGNFSSAQ